MWPLLFMARIPDGDVRPTRVLMGQAFRLALDDCHLDLSEAAGALDLNISQLHRQCDGDEPLNLTRIVLRLPEVFARWAFYVASNRDVQHILLAQGLSGAIAAFLVQPGHARMARLDTAAPLREGVRRVS